MSNDSPFMNKQYGNDPAVRKALIEHFPGISSLLTQLDNEQKEDLAYLLLQSIPTPQATKIIERLDKHSYTQHLLEALPQELIIDILCHLNVKSLLELSLVSRYWYSLCQDSIVWRYLFEAEGWRYNALAMERYLSKDASSSHYVPPPTKQAISATPVLLQSTPITRSSAPLYQRHLLQKIAPIAATSVLKKPFKSILAPSQPVSSSSTSSSSSSTPVLSPPLISRKSALSQKVASNKTRAVVAPRSDHEQLLPHYDAKTQTKFIDWKLLYRHRHKIAAAWRRGRYRPYRFRSDPASLRRQQQEESEVDLRNHVHGASANMDLETVAAALPTVLASSTSASTSGSSTTGDHSTAISSSPSSSTTAASMQPVSLVVPKAVVPVPEQQLQSAQEESQQYIAVDHSELRRQQQQQRDQHQDAVYSLSLDATHHTIFSASRDQTLKEWYFDHAVATLQHTYSDLHQGSILCLDVDQHYIVSGSKDKTVVQTDRCLRQKIRVLRGHQDSVLNVVLGEGYIFSASKDRTIKIWSSITGELQRTLHGHREAVNAIKAHQDRIVSASGDRTIKLWNRDTGECIHTFLGHERAISCLDFDGTSIVSGSNDKNIIIWDIHGKMLRKFHAHTGLVRTLQLQTPLESSQLLSSSSSASPRMIVSAGYNDNVNIWDFHTGQLLHTFPRYYQGRIINLRFDNMKIVLGLDSGDIVVYDFAFGLDSRFLI